MYQYRPEDVVHKPVPARATAIAVMLGRQDAATAMGVNEVASDSLRLATIGKKVRRKLELNQKLGSEITKAREIAARYRAILVELSDPQGYVLGLQFQHGLYSLRYGNWLPIA